ncbi:LOW QUALITY PROTEIN: deleted in malignant brain tumors 1 protein-like, partial [Gymnodraco acuticeps]|uniref:LOW QUALITY PROTEIN: deleted in malignant brain tumors 1 protein-like n=1 Tax=Gymnodraco acuticeps TaxID=8218 RepID=A0A6P8UC61_GYMAC
VKSSPWTLEAAGVLCRDLDCGSAVSVGEREESSKRSVWRIRSGCVESASALRECLLASSSSHFLTLTCSDSVRLVNGTGLCSGRLEVNSNQSDPSWSSVCEADFDQQDAQVVCRQLGCGASSVLQGALYGEGEAPMGTKEFQCGGHESALLDCSSASERNTCSPGSAVSLTCSEPDEVRLVGGESRCAGALEVKHQGEWRTVWDSPWTLKAAGVACRELNCGSAVSVGEREETSERRVWGIRPTCAQSASALRECAAASYSSHFLTLTCSDSVRLLGGTSLCSGRLEVKSNQSNQSNPSWSSVCEADFDQQDAQVVCRQLGCGAPSVLQGALYGEGEAPMGTKEFQCGGHESALLDCSSASERNTCSPGRAVSLTCSGRRFKEPVRLVGGESRCTGELEVKQGEWRAVKSSPWTLEAAGVACRDLDCGSAVSVGRIKQSSERPVWEIRSKCVESGSALRDCATATSYSYFLTLSCSEPGEAKLVGGESRCAGTLEVKHQGAWRPVKGFPPSTLKAAGVACRELDCGSAVSVGERVESSERPVWWILSACVESGSALRQCALSGSSSHFLTLTCSDSVRLVNGTSLCSGRLEVNSNQSNQSDPSWSSVCEADFDQQDAQVVCRQLGCGAPSVLQGALYGEGEAPMGTKEFQCGGHESALLDCSSASERSTCSPGTAVGLTCSEPVRLVGGESRCAGALEVKHHREWRPVWVPLWTLKAAGVACRDLDCGSAVSVGERKSSFRPVWGILSDCARSGSALRECAVSSYSSNFLTIACSDSVRLVNGTSLCSGRLEVKSNQSNPSWSSVCEADFDQQDAQVVCRQLGCGAPSVLQGALYGEGEAPMGTKEFQCGGHESALLDCSSASERNTCSPGRAVGLTCSEPVRLVGGESRCEGALEVKQGEWRTVKNSPWTLKTAGVACRELDCGSAVSVGEREESSERPVWGIRPDCVQSGSALRECATATSSSHVLTLTCSDSVRLVNGTSLCSGRLEVKSNQSNPSWSSVCEADFDQQDAQVVCRQLGCRAPSVLQGALYGEGEAPMWTTEFQCGGHESALLDCSSASERNTCSPGRAVGLTCSEPVRLVGGESRCAGDLEVKQGEWRPVKNSPWTLKTAGVLCRELDCGSAVSLRLREESSKRSVWGISPQCVESGSALRECAAASSSSYFLTLTCSEPVRLVEGESRCAGTLEGNLHGEWRPVGGSPSLWTLKIADDVCRDLKCGSAVSVGERVESSERSVWDIMSTCVQSGSALRQCAESSYSSHFLTLTCSDSVRLVNGTSLCSGRLEVNSNQSNPSNPSWSSVCEADFDQQDAQVVCRQLGCGAPSVLQGALYGEGEAPMGTKEFQCGGHESALLDCSSASERNTCSPGTAVSLTCSEPVYFKLVGGERRCAGELELNHQGEWRTVFLPGPWTLKAANVFCRDLDCGSAVSVGEREESSERPVWGIRPACIQSGSALRQCAAASSSSHFLTLTCSDSVRLVNGTSLCSGRLEVKSNQSNQSNPSWSSVCEADFDQQDAQVVCRQLGCGAPSVLQGALYGEGEAPMWTTEFQCGGHESALLDCSSASERSTCSPGRAVSLTCSEPDEVRLVGGESRCAGDMEVKHQGEWRPVESSLWTLKAAGVACRDLDCGSDVYVGERVESSERPVWRISPQCVESGSALRECATAGSSSYFLTLSCSEPGEVKLVGGESRCAGTLEVKHQGAWRPVKGFPPSTLKAAGVACRELDCGSAVSVGERISSFTPVWEILSDCAWSGSALRECALSSYSSNFLTLTCSDSVRLLGGTGLCSGRLEVNSNQSNQSDPSWSSVCEADFDQQDAQVVCRQLGCRAPSVLQGALYGEGEAPMGTKEFQCGGHESALLDCSSASERSTCSPGRAVSLTCSEPVRLVGGESRCAGDLEVKHHREWRPVWVPLWTLKAAGVACRELDCGSAVSVGERKSSFRPVWGILSDCARSGSALRECAVSSYSSNVLTLTCSEPVRLVGGESRCSGALEVRLQGEWRPVESSPPWTLKAAGVACRDLDCGSAASVGEREESSERSVWRIRSACVQYGSALRECAAASSSSHFLTLTCSDSVRLVNGTSLCSGRLEVNSNQSNQSDPSWSSVCEADFDQQDAQVVCRQLGCGAPSVLQGALYGGGEAPMGTKEFQCGGHESALLDCSSASERNTCSPGRAVSLTCSEPVRLVGGESRCAGALELKLWGEWRPVIGFPTWTLKEAKVLCRDLDCGSAVSVGERVESSERSVWGIRPTCVESESALRECAAASYSSYFLTLTCSEPVRLVGGERRCEGDLEVKHRGEWRPVGGFNSLWTLKAAGVLCRYLDCGSAVSVGERKESSFRPLWWIRPTCVQSGSALRECALSGSFDHFLTLTCSDSVRLVNGTSLCSGRLEVKSNQSNPSWSSVCEADFDQQDAQVVCRQLGCGAPSVLQGALYGEGEAPMGTTEFQCGGHESALLDCSSASERNTCSPGTAVSLTCSEPVRLVGGESRCAGDLELKLRGEWRPVIGFPTWTLEAASVLCRELDCGSAVSVGEREESSERSVWGIRPDCVQYGSALRECAAAGSSSHFLTLTCSDSVRLVNGTSLCSGRLEVKSNQSNQSNPSWSSVCEADFDQQDAQVVCRQLGCGAPSVLQGALYGEGEAPMGTTEFQCGGHESALLDCSSASERNTCSPGRAVSLTCSDPVRLVGGESRCAGTLEVKHRGEWRPVGINSLWTLKTAGVPCRELNCGSAVSVGERKASSKRSVWRIRPQCVQSASALRECAVSSSSSHLLTLTCSDSVRLVNGTSPCSGRLEVKSNQSNPSWSSVCEADFDQQDAQVVCRQLGCGAPSVLQGALYGEGEAPMGTTEFQCGGHESALLDCSSASERNTCSPGRAVSLTCSEPDEVRLVGGESRCAGTLSVKHRGEWRPVDGSSYPWNLKTAGVGCRELDCGSAVSVGERKASSKRIVWRIRPQCVQSGSALRECAVSSSSSHLLTLTCSDSVRLVNGTSLCSGRLEVNSDHSNQSNPSWSSVCEADFDQQDAQVVCRQLGCGAPSVLQGALYGGGEAPMWTKEFQCGGHESALLDCSSASERNTCSPGRAVSLTCSEPVRLVGGESRCAGDLEVKHQGEWRPVWDSTWTLNTAGVACRDLDCGSAVSLGDRESSKRSVWWICPQCVQSASALRECAVSSSSSHFMTLTCSEP